MQELLLYFFIILTASILQTSTGFGFSIMATPFLLLLFSPQEAMQINIVLSLVISCSLIWRVRHDIDTVLLKRIIIGSVVGAPFGSIVFALVDATTFKLIIAILLIGLTFLMMKNFSIQQTSGSIDLSSFSSSRSDFIHTKYWDDMIKKKEEWKRVFIFRPSL